MAGQPVSRTLKTIVLVTVLVVAFVVLVTVNRAHIRDVGGFASSVVETR